MLLDAYPDRLSGARELLDNCVNIEAQFDIWLSVVQQMTRASGAPYWVADSAETPLHSPFDEMLSFANPLLCLVHVYYWTVLITFHQCIYALLEVVGEPEGEGSDPGASSALPSGLDPRKYQPAETTKLAALVCRSLDFALRTTTQPDLLVAPVWIIQDFYNRMKIFGLCELESLWVDDFIERQEARGHEMSAWLEEKRWIGIRQFG